MKKKKCSNSDPFLYNANWSKTRKKEYTDKKKERNSSQKRKDSHLILFCEERKKEPRESPQKPQIRALKIKKKVKLRREEKKTHSYAENKRCIPEKKNKGKKKVLLYTPCIMYSVYRERKRELQRIRRRKKGSK